jgi:DNA-binding response OmpR family regulator
MGQAQQDKRVALIVEDDADLRWLMSSLFEESEFEIIECESAEAALATMLLRGRDVKMILPISGFPGSWTESILRARQKCVGPT